MRFLMSVFFLILLSSCISQKIEPKKVSSYQVQSDDGLGCLQMTDAYCKSLYDPEALGNLQVLRPKGSITILQGDTANDFSQVFFQYSKAKISRSKNLPPLLKKTLDEVSYFEKLQELLDRPPLSAMTFAERIKYDRLANQVDGIWDAALNETILRRLVAKYKGFHQLNSKELPPEYEIEYQKEKRRLLNQISLALWKEDKKWQNVEQTFENLKLAYLRVLDHLNVDDKARQDMKTRIQEVKLFLPGSLPEIADYECSSTTVNAYYYKFLNLITVCAGDFNSEDILQTLAHEIGHALDFSRSLYLKKMSSRLVKNQQILRSQVCTQKAINCDFWDGFKKTYASQTADLDSFQPELKEFQQCLKRKANTKTPNNEDFERIAANKTTTIYSSLAGADYFLRIIKDKLPLRNGKLVSNPYYLNPCKYYLWTKDEEPPEDAINSLVYFTAEYTCSAKNPASKDVFKNAIEISRTMTEQIIKSNLRMEGEFSSNDLMMNEGFSSPPEERFADVLASHAIAEYLKSTPSIADRRGKMLASVSWLCSEPSLQSHFPEESKIENDYSNDSHTDGLVRFQEILAPPLRASLQCKKDFEFNECLLPLK